MTDPLQRFASAVPHYVRYRSGYPGREVDRLAAGIGLDARRRAVDVGCGSGQLTIPLARHAGTVMAVDPVPAMLEQGREAADAAGVANIAWVQGDAGPLRALVAPGVRAATFAASFHWVDRARILEDLDALLEPAGSVVVLDDDLDEAELPGWDHAIAEVRDRYPGLEPLPGATRPLPRSHRDVLLSSPFSHVRVATWSWSRQLTVDEVVGLQLSYSFSTPELLGDRLGAFCRDVRRAVLALHPHGTVIEALRVRVLTASRRTGTAGDGTRGC